MNTAAPALVVSHKNPRALCFGIDATRGAFWMCLFAGLNKLVAFGSQLALGWLLIPQHFGLAAMALSVTNLTSFVSSANFRNLLIQQRDVSQEDACQVFWLSLAASGGMALLIVSLSPVAVLVFEEPRILPLIWIAAMSSPVQALSTLYAARLGQQLRFQTIAAINFGAGLVQNTLAVVLALLGFGAYALIVPLIGMAIFVALAYRLSSARIRVGKPTPRRWFELGRPAIWLMAWSLFTALQLHGANFAISAIEKDPVTMGYFYWGYLVAMQLVFLLSGNLQSVLFPVFSKLHTEQERQLTALDKSCQTLAAIVLPVCLLQYWLAEPVITLLFGERWKPAIPVVQWLSIGLLTYPMNLVAGSVLLAQGRFRRLAFTSGLVTLAVTAGAMIGAIAGEQREIGRAVAIGLLVGNVLAASIALGPIDGAAKVLLKTLGMLVAFSAPVAGLAWWIQAGLVSHGLAVSIVGTALALGTIYALLLMLFKPNIISDLLARVKPQA